MTFEPRRENLAQKIIFDPQEKVLSEIIVTTFHFRFKHLKTFLPKTDNQSD